MTAVVILNVVLATLVVTVILSLLGWGIVSDRWAARGAGSWPGLTPPTYAAQ